MQITKTVLMIFKSWPFHSGSLFHAFSPRKEDKRFWWFSVCNQAKAIEVLDSLVCYCLLISGEKGIGKSGKPLHYKGSTFHRVIPNFMCQVGSFQSADAIKLLLNPSLCIRACFVLL
jgi:hypothetical protein